MNETATTGTTRPTSIADLSDWERRGTYVATIYSEQLVKFPSLGQHLLAALGEAERLGLAVTNGEIVIDLTPEQLEEKVAQKQRAWDSNQDAYLRALRGEQVYSWQRGQVDAWATAEGLDPIDWDGVPA